MENWNIGFWETAWCPQDAVGTLLVQVELCPKAHWVGQATSEAGVAWQEYLV